MKIVQLNEIHIEEIRSLWNDQLDYEAYPSAVLEFYISRAPAFGAYVDDRLIGFILTRVASKDDIIELYQLLVASGSRHHGVGTSLVRAVESYAKEQGYSSIILTNSMRYGGEGKESAVPFYEKLGYKTLKELGQTSLLEKSLQ